MTWEKRNSIGARALLAAAVVLAASGYGHVAAKAPPAVTHLAQNWSDSDRYRWYRGSQGSRLIPAKWLKALEAPDSQMLFMDRAYVGRFGYLYTDQDRALAAARPILTCRAEADDEQWLPIGFARDCQSDKKLRITKLRWYKGQKSKEHWIGLNCAACHTSEIVYEGQAHRIDGAATLADFQGFSNALHAAMDNTLRDPGKWERFARRVLPAQPAGRRGDARRRADEAMLKAEFARLLDHQKQLYAYNRTGSVYGYGRLDAVGHILNKVAFVNQAPLQYRGEPNAPVSYPFIWNAHQHDRLQWNGSVKKIVPFGDRNLDIGATIRNTTEVIGVFAELTTKRNTWLEGYRSSVDMRNLNAMENQLRRLMSPVWPARFGVPDPDKVREGRALFTRPGPTGESCASCHAHLRPDDLSTPIVAKMTPVLGDGGVGTDPWMMCNAFSYEAMPGNLRGTREKIVFGPRLPATSSPTRAFLETQALGVMLNNKWKLVWEVVTSPLGRKARRPEARSPSVALAAPRTNPGDQPLSADQRLQKCKDAPKEAPGDAHLVRYKARPLNGIWATAPYLHNGSVKSLYELLLPPADRDPEFWVGNPEFDPVNVGFVDGKSAAHPYGSKFSVRDFGGHGNSNAGHDYGNARYTPAQRRALVEYMKTL